MQVWHELRRWNTHQLVAGGLLDQPDWTWDLIDLAGTLFQESQKRAARREEAVDQPLGKPLDIRGKL